MLSWEKKTELISPVSDSGAQCPQQSNLDQSSLSHHIDNPISSPIRDDCATPHMGPKDGVLNGRITALKSEFGFIESVDVPKPIYFKLAWYKGTAPLAVGDEVSFHVREVAEGKYTAQNISRMEDEAPAGSGHIPQPRLLNWAYLGFLPDALRKLSEMALEEDWQFKNNPDPERPTPILHSYLLQTYARLVDENKVLVDDTCKVAAFNTGLVDKLYEPIYALFEPQDDPRTPWRLADFCKAGAGVAGQRLVRHFLPLPARAHYFDSPSDLVYDVERAGLPEFDPEHVIIDRIERWPAEFIEQHAPSGFCVASTDHMSTDERDAYFRALGEALRTDSASFRNYRTRLKDALELALKRVAWNFKTAIPQYYPSVKKLQLLLPLCIVRDEVVDAALAVEKTKSGGYLGHTVLKLDWAYNNARLICRPDSDWLSPKNIIEDKDSECS